MTRELPADLVAELSALPDEEGPFNPQLSLGHLPMAGHIVYSLDPQWIRLQKSWAATNRTYVEFEGQTAFGEQSRIPFHVSSLDWQESDRVLAGIMTAFGAPTGAVPMGGYGEFDGVLLEAFKRPRIQGTLKGERFRAWDVVWGTGRADLAIENSYVFVANATLTEGDSEIRADGQFSLGFPRRDGGDEIDARVRVTRRPLVDLRHAFNLDDYPIQGTVSGEYQLYGKYQTPFGFGRLNIEKGTAYGETFDAATSSLRFEGAGVRLDNLDIRKSTGGMTGAAYVGWDGTYSFNADGARIPVESLVSVAFPRAPLSGRLQFTATGAGTFDEPRYDVKLAVDDLFAGDEGIGQLSGRLNLRGDLLTLDLEAASPRLVVSGSGRIALTDEMDAELTVRFRETSLDPYVRFFEPRLSPFTTAIVGGTMRVVGELANTDQLVVDATVEQLDLKLFDYRVRNDGPIELTLDQNILQIGRFRLAGEGTQLQLDGRLGSEGSDDRRAGDGRREPRYPAGLLPRSPQSWHGRPQSAAVRHVHQADLFRERHAQRRAAPALLAAALARGDQRTGVVRRQRHPGRRGHRSSGRGQRQLRRPHRTQRLRARGPEPHRDRRAHGGALSGGVPLDHRRRSRAAGDDERARAQRDRGRAGRRVVEAHRDQPRPLQSGRRVVDGARIRSRGGGDAAAAVRRRHRRGVQPAHPEQRRQHGGERGPEAAGHRTSARSSSAAPRSSAATCCSKATASSSRRAAASISSTRRGSNPSSTSRPRRVSAVPGSPIA